MRKISTQSILLVLKIQELQKNKIENSIGPSQSDKFTKVTMVPAIAGRRRQMRRLPRLRTTSVKSRKDRARDQHLSERLGNGRTSVQQPLRPPMFRE